MCARGGLSWDVVRCFVLLSNVHCALRTLVLCPLPSGPSPLQYRLDYMLILPLESVQLMAWFRRITNIVHERLEGGCFRIGH
jgi:hypothetical protein